MSVENFLHSTASLVTALGALLAAAASLVTAFRSFWAARPSEPSRAEPSRPSALISLLRMPAFALGILLILVSVGIFVARQIVPPPPEVAITEPANGQQIEVRILAETGAGSFGVSGSSAEVYDDPALRLYVLVHPADPFASGWWVQQAATVDRDGQWATQAWIGNQDFPPHAGDKIDILAIVTDPARLGGRNQIGDPKDAKPDAQSDIIRVSIGSIK